MRPESQRYFEDLEPGESLDCGSLAVEREEMLRFAERYDPQRFHVDEAAAEETMFGGLIASGWLTCALTSRLAFGNGLTDVATLGARGVDEVRWHNPVYPGDTLSTRLDLLETHAGENPTFGSVTVEFTTTNQHGATVLTMTAHGLIEKREAT
jgi:acyl dehydratase